MESKLVEASRRMRPDWLLNSLASAAAIRLLQGAGCGWILWFVGAFAAAFALFSGFRGRVLQEFWRAWGAVCVFPFEGAAIPWRAIFLLVVLPDALFLLLREQLNQSCDSRPVVMTAANLLARHTTDLSNFAESYVRAGLLKETDDPPYFFLRRPDGLYSHYQSGMVPFALPVVAAGRALGADLDSVVVQLRLEKLTAAWVSAACLGWFFLLALYVVDSKAAWLMTLMLATGSVMFSTVGQALWQQGGVIFWTLALLLAEFRGWRSGGGRLAALQGACCAMMLACRMSAGVIVAAFGAWVFLNAPRRALAIGAATALCFAPWAAFHWCVYGAPVGPMNVQMYGQFWAIKPAAWCGVLFSPMHGLFIYQPWLLLGLLAAPALRRRLPPPRAPLPSGWQAWAASVIVVHLAMVSSWWCWWGGWCWGSRLASEAIPLAALLTLAPLGALLASPRGRTLVASLAVLSMLAHVPPFFRWSSRWDAYRNACTDKSAQWRWSAAPFLHPFRR